MQVVDQLLYKLRNQSFLYRRGGKGGVGWGKRNIIKPYGCSGKSYWGRIKPLLPLPLRRCEVTYSLIGSLLSFWTAVICSTHSIRCEKLVDFLEGAKCPLAPGSYEVKQQTRSMPDIPIPSFLKNVSLQIFYSIVFARFENHETKNGLWIQLSFFFSREGTKFKQKWEMKTAKSAFHAWKWNWRQEVKNKSCQELKWIAWNFILALAVLSNLESAVKIAIKISHVSHLESRKCSC